ncbi:GTP cyclohydrolase FolE2 [Beggiatoa leptomitoformis]|uniref:GTP cyclohydrolase FolE2 n=1 Tax=Beggiatoa leptomitoformis TaxID=288004 RepID=A0A2N9YAW3_9GAMM|nr:GTP cyclohydrolase FolE2 [Beggiatoa leptomitoformis]ALG67022.1 GTP cyclohydrolase I FolE2 [Beggiatoa leptomitoformis]AUI67601.1 GTP cyclohydrolase I FolE2 [Beggiatoa leptomitoformis]
MNKPLTSIPDLSIPDTQRYKDTRQLVINKVGIKSIRHPICISDRAKRSQPTIATFNMYVMLSADNKGTHMSRFVKLLNELETPLSVETFPTLLAEMTKRLEAEQGFIETQFTYFVNKAAPITGVKSLLDYTVTLTGDYQNGITTQTTQVLVPVTSLCPCSKEISEYGAHNQRAHITVAVKTQATVWIEEIIEMVEAEASSELFGLLKRPDEKAVTERAYENPKFVEDVVRDVAARLNAESRILAYTVESENFESIHNHSAYALIERDKRK